MKVKISEVKKGSKAKTSQSQNRKSKSQNSKTLFKRKARKFPLPDFIHQLRRHRKLILLLAAAAVFSYFFIFKNLPSPAKLRENDAFVSSTRIFDRNGKLLYEIYSDKNRTPVSLANLPPYVSQSHIAIEDKNFYQHHGFASEGLIRATYNTIFRKKLQGGSTITQQLVKTTLLTPERTIRRKVREAVLAFLSEIFYSKNQILEMYLNHIPYGGTAWGIEAAAHTYFAKSADQLTLAEAALLAGLPAAPTRYSPFGTNPEIAKERQKLVLSRMLEDGYITPEQKAEAESENLQFAAPSVDIKAPHFVLWVKEMLVESFGERLVEKGGLKVTTTLDLDLQEYAAATVAAQIKDLEKMRVGNGAALITKPKTGEILAMVGSHNYFDQENDGNVNVTIRPRQPGSSIKPINYAAAFETGRLNPASLLLDLPTCFFVPNQPLYCPRNYDNTFHGPVQVRFALGNSYNIPAVKALAINSVESMIATASAMGIQGWDNPEKYGLSLTLGGGEVRMVDMAVAFGVFANQGIKIPLQSVLKVEDSQGNILLEYKPDAISSLVDQLNSEPESKQGSGEIKRVLSRAASYLISHILLDNNARAGAFGPSSELVIKNKTVSVKTGTTNDLRDNWTIGYTPSYLTAVWVGNNDNSPMHPYLVSGITGAAPIWHDLMQKVLLETPAEWPEKPDTVIGMEVCSPSGLLPNPDNPCSTRHEFFIQGFEPQRSNIARKEIWIKKDTGLPPEEGDFENLELQEHTVISDPLVADFCLDCPWPQEIDEQGQPTGKIYYPPAEINTSTLFS